MEELSPFEKAVVKAEYEIIVDALKKTKFSKVKAAAHLGIDRKTLYNKIERYQEIYQEEKVA